jgi:hypothetical protein
VAADLDLKLEALPIILWDAISGERVGDAELQALGPECRIVLMIGHCQVTIATALMDVHTHRYEYRHIVHCRHGK